MITTPPIRPTLHRSKTYARLRVRSVCSLTSGSNSNNWHIENRALPAIAWFRWYFWHDAERRYIFMTFDIINIVIMLSTYTSASRSRTPANVFCLRWWHNSNTTYILICIRMYLITPACLAKPLMCFIISECTQLSISFCCPLPLDFFTDHTDSFVDIDYENLKKIAVSLNFLQLSRAELLDYCTRKDRFCWKI